MFALFYVAYDVCDDVLCCADNLVELAEKLGVSVRTLQRAFARVYGVKPTPPSPDCFRVAVCNTIYGMTKIYMFDVTNW